MAVLDYYTDPSWLDEDDDQDDAPVWPSEALTITVAGGWWSAGLDLDTDDDN